VVVFDLNIVVKRRPIVVFILVPGRDFVHRDKVVADRQVALIATQLLRRSLVAVRNETVWSEVVCNEVVKNEASCPGSRAMTSRPGRLLLDIL
jgi:hypothetical protein